MSSEVDQGEDITRRNLPEAVWTLLMELGYAFYDEGSFHHFATKTAIWMSANYFTQPGTMVLHYYPTETGTKGVKYAHFNVPDAVEAIVAHLDNNGFPASKTLRLKRLNALLV